MDGNLQKYAAFVRTAELGSFTKAAAALQYSQSGVSRMVADLERDLGITLLERRRGGVRPTADGQALLPYARALVAQQEKLQTRADELRGLQTGLIRIGVFSSVATHWLPPILQAFGRDYPEIRFELLQGDYTEIEAWVRSGRADCGFVRLPAGEGLETVFLEQDPLLAVLPPSHPLAGEAVFPVTGFSGAPFLLLGRGEHLEIARLLEQCSLHPEVHLTAWDDYAIMHMVEMGLGLSVLPGLILRRCPYRIVALPLDVPAYRRIGFALRDKKTASLAVRRFMEYLSYRDKPTDACLPQEK